MPRLLNLLALVLFLVAAILTLINPVNIAHVLGFIAAGLAATVATRLVP